jgi:hypothetical protein
VSTSAADHRLRNCHTIAGTFGWSFIATAGKPAHNHRRLIAGVLTAMVTPFGPVRDRASAAVIAPIMVSPSHESVQSVTRHRLRPARSTLQRARAGVDSCRDNAPANPWCRGTTDPHSLFERQMELFYRTSLAWPALNRSRPSVVSPWRRGVDQTAGIPLRRVRTEHRRRVPRGARERNPVPLTLGRTATASAGGSRSP